MKTPPATKQVPGFTHVQTKHGISEYRLKANGLTVLYQHIPGTGVVTTDMVYQVGSRDEAVGETGIAHMLEHMLFKPTKNDRKHKRASGAIRFEREVGAESNASTWKDRTTYFFVFPSEHLDRALGIHAETMTEVDLSDKEFLPEQGNVLSEADMYAGEPIFALSMLMVGSAFQSHPYGHETIGWRPDIERLTAAKLERFYRTYYRPDNASLMIVGDAPLLDALKLVREHFSSIANPPTPILRHSAVEPKQEGVRRVSIRRQSKTNVLGIGVKHAGLPHNDWFATSLLFSMLCSGPDSVLSTAFVDTGKVTGIDYFVEPTNEENLGVIFLTLAPGQEHAVIEAEVLAVINKLTAADLKKPFAKARERILTDDRFDKTSSYSIVYELIEFVAAGDWTLYGETEAILKRQRLSDILKLRTKLFSSDRLTIGTFVGTK